jgi:proteasome accessory factor B
VDRLRPIPTGRVRAAVAPKVERLVNLTIALLEARRPMSLEDLRRRTGYYDQRDRESARRMFERDKDELRSLGVPVRTEHDPLSGEAGYVVDRRDYELPDVDLDRDEMAALAVALRVTGRADERLALSKLAARAPDPVAAPATVEARVALETQAVDGVADAVVGRQAIRFSYQTGSGEQRERTVDPYGVVLRRGTWYVVGRDHDRDDLRAFRLDRVRSRVRPVGEPGAYEIPDDVDPGAHVQGPVGEATDVLLAVSSTARWAAEARGGHPAGTHEDGRDLVRLDDVDPTRLLPWVLGFGADVEVLDPPELRDRVRDRLAAMVAAT